MGLGGIHSVYIATDFKVPETPILEYACPLWNPYLVKGIYEIESVQRRPLRLICGSGKVHEERLGELKWDSL